MKIVAILASGTGGHVYPAYTIAQNILTVVIRFYGLELKTDLKIE